MSLFYIQLRCGQEKQVWRAKKPVAFIPADTSASAMGNMGFVMAEPSPYRVTCQRGNCSDEKR